MQFSPKDIIRIIKACQKSQVSSLKLGELEISLTSSRRNAETKHVKFAVSEKESAEIEKLASEQILAETVGRELDELLISDPAAYEEKLATGELGDAEA